MSELDPSQFPILTPRDQHWNYKGFHGRARFAIELLPEPPSSILDLGCGDCVIERLFPDAVYQGVDWKPILPQVMDWDLRQGLPTFPHRFDVVFILGLFEHLGAELSVALVQQLSALSSKLILTYRWHPNCMGLPDILKALGSAGWVVKNSEKVSNLYMFYFEHGGGADA